MRGFDRGIRRVLLVDDESSVRRLIAVTLQDEKIQFIEAADGPEAIRLAQDQRPDMILLDWWMPQMTGGEVLAALRRDPRTADIPVVVLTATTDPQIHATARAAGAARLFTKPFSPLELIDQRDRLLNN